MTLLALRLVGAFLLVLDVFATLNLYSGLKRIPGLPRDASRGLAVAFFMFVAMLYVLTVLVVYAIDPSIK